MSKIGTTRPQDGNHKMKVVKGTKIVGPDGKDTGSVRKK
jgi:hypothetical protein